MGSEKGVKRRLVASERVNEASSHSILLTKDKTDKELRLSTQTAAKHNAEKVFVSSLKQKKILDDLNNSYVDQNRSFTSIPQENAYALSSKSQERPRVSLNGI